MKSHIFPRDSANPPRSLRGFLALISIILALALAAPLGQSQSLVSTSQIYGLPDPSGGYDYTITLNNSASSTASIQTFWFAWLAGQADFMGSSPTAVTAPQGWSYSIEGGGAGDGYSIKFTTFSTPIAPGNSLKFYFSSPDTPMAMGGMSPAYPLYPVLSADVYSGHTSGIRVDTLVQLVPEPAEWALLSLGVLAFFVLSRRPRPKAA